MIFVYCTVYTIFHQFQWFSSHEPSIGLSLIELYGPALCQFHLPQYLTKINSKLFVLFKVSNFNNNFQNWKTIPRNTYCGNKYATERPSSRVGGKRPWFLPSIIKLSADKEQTWGRETSRNSQLGVKSHQEYDVTCLISVKLAAIDRLRSKFAHNRSRTEQQYSAEQKSSAVNT